MNKQEIISKFLLLLVAILYGLSYILMQIGGNNIGPFLFSGLRELIAAITLFCIISYRHHKKTLTDDNVQQNHSIFYLLKKKLFIETQNKQILVKASLLLSVILIFATVSLQIGVMFTQTFKSAFINSLYVLFVPIFGLCVGKKIHIMHFICVFIAVIGLYFLFIAENYKLEMNIGDLFILIAACLWAIQFLIIDHYISNINPIELLCIQFSLASIPTLLLSLFLDHYFMDSILEFNLSNTIFALIYTGVFASALACSLQMYAQRNIKPIMTSLIISMENIFALLAGMLFLQEYISLREFLGCLLIITAIIVIQLPWNNKNQHN